MFGRGIQVPVLVGFLQCGQRRGPAGATGGGGWPGAVAGRADASLAAHMQAGRAGQGRDRFS